MQLIKLNATDSTNTYLKTLLGSKGVDDFTVVVAEEQLNGRGQMGTVWESQKSKNLTFSVLKKFQSFYIADKFLISCCVSLAIYRVLEQQRVPDLSIKWPNDILSGNSKICGILIENIIVGDKIQMSIIGIGLNVNQSDFGQLQQASSLKIILGKVFDLNEILDLILKALKIVFTELEQKESDRIIEAYEQLLFRKDKPSTFEDRNKGNQFMGFIRGVSVEGKLSIELEDNIVRDYDFKELRLLY